MIGFLLLALLQQPTPSPDVALQFGLRVFQGERVMSSVTTGQNEAVSGSVWADSTLCGVGGGSNASSGPDRIRWQYSGRIVQRTSSSYTVEIDWQRDGGSFSSAPKTTQQFVLPIGAPQVLDTLTPPSTNACGVSSLRFEAAVVPLSTLSSVAYGGFGVGGAGGRGRGVGTGSAGAAGGSGGGRGRGVGGSVGSGSGFGGGGGRGAIGTGVNGAGANANAGGTSGPSPILYGSSMTALEFARLMGHAPGTIGTWARSSGFGGAGGVGAGPTWTPRDDLRPIPNASYDAELWLVHTPPSGTEEAQHLTLHFGPDGEAAAFPGLTISTPSGAWTVNVAVNLQAMTDRSGATVLRVTIARQVVGPGTTMGGTSKIIPLPASSETVSFEMPDLRGSTIQALDDYRFAVRLKVTPGKDDVVR